MEVNEVVRTLILNSAPSQDIKRVALANQRSLREDGILKLKLGLTTPEELLRVTID